MLLVLGLAQVVRLATGEWDLTPRVLLLERKARTLGLGGILGLASKEGRLCDDLRSEYIACMIMETASQI